MTVEGKALDPVTLALVRAAFTGISDEMCAAPIHSSHSPKSRGDTAVPVRCMPQTGVCP